MFGKHGSKSHDGFGYPYSVKCTMNLISLFFCLLCSILMLPLATTAQACKTKPRLSTFEPNPNYAIWQGTDNDDNAIEVHYSLRYTLTHPYCIEDESTQDYAARWELYFSYAGQFDYYITRDSGPVINRVSNPAIHYRKYYPDTFFEWLDISIEHRSNGQVTEIDERDGAQLKTQIAYHNGDYAYFDGLSRGANYFKLMALFDLDNNAKLWTSVKFYSDDDSEVNWGPGVLTKPSIRDYDRVKLTYRKRWGEEENEKEFTFEWRFGEEGLDTDSYDIAIMVPFELWDLNLPLYLRIHTGPMNTLSNYTEELDSIALGLKFTEF